ncbi:hypothetical protein ACFRAR_14785 [Kitasatospora sp. NPDC056651]|uniref:hypothetical protein n=1 Tax=Kitasatospora sp. NPDC056651 TaxID=3345892 RepID=UPI0036CCD482
MDLSPDQQDLEQVAASLVERTIVVAHRLAELAVDDERYDEAAAIVAAACAKRGDRVPSAARSCSRGRL